MSASMSALAPRLRRVPLFSDLTPEALESERVQPFKQVFRELYVVTDQEKADGAVSHRYAGHQVNPKQAMALFVDDLKHVAKWLSER